MIFVMEYGMNVFIFLVWVILFIESDLVFVVIVVFGMMKGLLYGGVFFVVIKMFEDIGEKENVEVYLKEKFEKGECLMGFGYRVYKMKDLRVEVL